MSPDKIKIRTLHPFVQGIVEFLGSHREESNSGPMKKYMRNQFEFLGITSTPRRLFCAGYIKSAGLPPYDEMERVVRELWDLPEREFHYFAIEVMMKYKKKWTEQDESLIEFLIMEKSWWDTVDAIANHIAGPWFKRFPSKIITVTKRWNRSDNIWLQRMSLLFQLKYKQSTDTNLLSNYINHLSGSNEFFVQKAIGWILREYSKFNPGWVWEFVNTHKLKPLSKREALKVITRRGGLS
jgi:3-methyladenine DNA glycosylase AlkD